MTHRLPGALTAPPPDGAFAQGFPMQTLSLSFESSDAPTLPNDTLDDTLEPPSSSRRLSVVLDVAGATHPGCVRHNNEDAYGIFPDLGFCAVADGLGGRAGGEIASSMAVHEVHEALLRGAVPDPDGTLRGALAQAVTHANSAIHAAGLADMRLKGMATTFVGLLVSGGRAILAHVGDSRIYRIRRGVAERLTVDHSMRELYLQVFKGRADPEVAAKNASAVTRAVGARPSVAVDLRVEELEPGDTFLLCSDGLWGLISDEEIAFAVAVAPTLETALASLIAMAYNRGGPDNITAVLARPRAPGSHRELDA